MRPIVRWMSKANTYLYRASGGRVGGTWMQGAPIMLLTTVGRRSGKERTAPLLFLRDGQNLLIVASQGGMSTHPAWYLNLQANPECWAEIGPRKMPMRAERLTDDEKATVWPALCHLYSDFDDYQARTERNIPVLRLTPRRA